MNIGLITLVVIFIAFILILVFNPNLSCFGKRLRSPFYPLFRRARLTEREKKRIQTDDYGFRLVEGEENTSKAEKQTSPQILKNSQLPQEKGKASEKKPKKTENYGFKLD